jgi:hypothetical protein
MDALHLMIFLSVGMEEEAGCCRIAFPLFTAIMLETFSSSQAERERDPTIRCHLYTKI